MSIDDLVSACDVTPQTIRRDLNQLAGAGVVSRYHGGAGLNRSWENTPYQERKTQNSEVKEKIAEAVAAMIPDGASLFINIGTTTELIATKLLNHKNLHVVTNNIHVATILSAKEDFSVIIAAVMRPSFRSCHVRSARGASSDPDVSSRKIGSPSVRRVRGISKQSASMSSSPVGLKLSMWSPRASRRPWPARLRRSPLRTSGNDYPRRRRNTRPWRDPVGSRSGRMRSSERT